MKKKSNFFTSLEKYVWKVVGRSPLPYAWVGVVMLGIILLASALSMRNSVVGANSMREVIRMAAQRGDYLLARELLTQQQTNELTEGGVLGVESELEDKVYPERVVERRIEELEQKLQEYPGNREIYLGLAELYRQIGKIEEAEGYLEKARVLDPNAPKLQN